MRKDVCAGPLWMMAAWNSPLLASDIRCAVTDMPPALSPKMVT